MRKTIRIPVTGAGRTYVTATLSSMGEPMLDWDEMREGETFVGWVVKGQYTAGIYLRRVVLWAIHPSIHPSIKEARIMATINTTTTNETITIETAAGTIVVHINKLAPHIIAAATIHGLKQKIVDAGAISRNTDTGRSATVNDKFDAMNEVFLRLTDPANPSWNKVERNSAGASGGLLFRALTRLYPSKTPEAIRAYLEPMDVKQQTTIRATSRVAEMIEMIKAEDAARKGKGDAGEDAGENLLAGLE
jgi:hypothetical protein